jgi:hypothetical protein
MLRPPSRERISANWSSASKPLRIRASRLVDQSQIELIHEARGARQFLRLSPTIRSALRRTEIAVIKVAR